MQTARFLRFTSITALGLSLAGCATGGMKQDIDVRSQPSGATVTVNGEQVATTPATLALGRGSNHQVVISKEHFDPETIVVAPRPNEKPFVRFGILDDLGYYNQLAPDPVEVSLRPALLPRVKSTQPFEEYTNLVIFADQLHDDREVSRQDYQYILEELTSFYTD